MQKNLTQNKTKAFLSKPLKGSWKNVKENCKSFISKTTEEKQMRPVPWCIKLEWLPLVIFLWESYFLHFYAVAKMIWWVKNPFSDWILVLKCSLILIYDSRKIHVVISDERSHNQSFVSLCFLVCFFFLWKCTVMTKFGLQSNQEQNIFKFKQIWVETYWK